MEGYVLKNLKVLVVEKQMFMRRLLGDVLAQLGIDNVVKVAQISEGIEAFSSIQFDLVLLDWAPDMDAVEFLAEVRNPDVSRDPFAPVIVVTAYSEYKHVCQARDAGMTEYLTKPISAKGLYGRIKSIIERHRYLVQTGDFFGPDRRRKRIPPTGGDRRKLVLDVQNA